MFYFRIVAVAALVFLFPFSSVRAQEQQEKWFEQNRPPVEKESKLIRADEYASEILAKEKGSFVKAKPWKQWSVSGKFGYEYDDNVRLAPNQKAFRPASEDISAGRYQFQTKLSYDFYRNSRYRAGISYSLWQSFHDDDLDQYNFQNHAVSIYGRRLLKTWDRPSEISLRYTFSRGFLKWGPFSISHSWDISWMGEWRENWVLTVYERLGVKNFHNEGFDPALTSRDGFYHETGFVQSYFFDHHRRRIDLGYEFAFDATRGNNFDQIANGARVGFKTPLIKKWEFETDFHFQDGDYPHFVGVRKRHDLRYEYEFYLSRPLGPHWKLIGFYKHTQVNTLHKGVLGVFNYNRNIYGVEMAFNY